MDNKELLKETWNRFSLDEILVAGLEQKKIDSSDIIHASDMYQGEKEYSDEDVKDMISTRGLDDIIEIIDVTYGSDEILEYIDNDDLLKYLDGSYELDDHDDEIRSKCYNNAYESAHKDIMKSIDEEDRNVMAFLQNANNNDLRTFFCDVFSVPYYDNEALYNNIDILVSKLKDSIYE